MGRKNRNVRQRNLPRAAQRQPKGQRTPSAQSDVRQHWTPEREPSDAKSAPRLKPLDSWLGV